MLDQDTWIIVPAHNEEKTIKQLVDELKKYTNNIVVVCDGPNDNTLEVVKNLNIIFLHHIVNLGKGSALKTGCDFAIKKNAKKMIVIDADLQHEPKEIPIFIENLKNNDIVLGYRKPNEKMPFVLRFGNNFINTVTRILFGVNLKDTQCGYRAFTTDAYQKIRWESTDYFMESEMIANIGKNKLKYTQIPIQTIYADKYKGTTVLDGITIVINLILWRFTKTRL